MQVGQFGAHLHAQLGVEIAERLVEQEGRGMADHGAAQRHALLLAARELAGFACQQLSDIERLGGLGHFARDAGAGGARAGQQRTQPRQTLPGVEAAHGQRQADILGHGHMRIERVGLEHHGDVAVARRQVVDAPAADVDFAAVVPFQPGDDAQQGGLAAARGAEQRQELAVGDVERDIVEDVDRAEFLGDFVQFYSGHRPGLADFCYRRYVKGAAAGLSLFRLLHRLAIYRTCLFIWGNAGP